MSVAVSVPSFDPVHVYPCGHLVHTPEDAQDKEQLGSWEKGQ